MTLAFKSSLLFIVAWLFRIGGGYLIWQWLKEGNPLWYGALESVRLTLYGVVATFQTASFGRIYAAYGGVLILLALVWA
ncbi:YnfA family protein [Mucilaginibacter robiniae]|uniref:YnfA family protein n=1 Tax=Mucilaginibacter robiniae TaxID=2728022 RepID=UPI002006EDF9|nr:YnfA family protein [Mucilaginibacter robiniae]